MASKEINFSDSARNKLYEGVRQLADAVKVTMGPRGRNVLIQKSFGAPSITKDGVSVAKEIELADAISNMGAQLVKEVASKTADAQVMERPQRPFWLMESLKRACATSPRVRILSKSKEEWTKPPLQLLMS